MVNASTHHWLSLLSGCHMYPHTFFSSSGTQSGTRTAAPLRSAWHSAAAWSRCFLTRTMQRVGQMISRFFQMVLLSPISSTISSLSYSGERHAPGCETAASPLSHAGTLQQAHQLLGQRPVVTVPLGRAFTLPVSARSAPRLQRAQTFRAAAPFTVSIAGDSPAHTPASLRGMRDDGSKRGIVGVFDPL
jgi:hypothetical protein